MRVWSNQNSNCFCWQIAFQYPMSLCLATSKGYPNYFNGWLKVWPEFPNKSFMVMAIWGLCNIRPHIIINDSALILCLGCLWAKCKIYWGQVLYLFLFSVVSSLSGWGCFSCCCGRDLTLFFSAAVSWVLSILLKIIKQHAIETEILLNNLFVVTICVWNIFEMNLAGKTDWIQIQQCVCYR